MYIPLRQLTVISAFISLGISYNNNNNNNSSAVAEMAAQCCVCHFLLYKNRFTNISRNIGEIYVVECGVYSI